jgi:hypothetical protein
MDRWRDGCDHMHHCLVHFQASLNQVTKYIDSHVSGTEEQFPYMNQNIK